MQVAPLSGLHQESLADAEAQLALLCRLLPGVTVPPTLGLLEVRLSALCACYLPVLSLTNII